MSGSSTLYVSCKQAIRYSKVQVVLSAFLLPHISRGKRELILLISAGPLPRSPGRSIPPCRQPVTRDHQRRRDWANSEQIRPRFSTRSPADLPSSVPGADSGQGRGCSRAGPAAEARPVHPASVSHHTSPAVQKPVTRRSDRGQGRG